MATKKSTPKKTNTKTKTSVARTAGKGFDAGMKSALGNDPKPYNRRKTSTPASQKKPIDRRADGTLVTEPPKASNASTARGQRLNSSASMPKGEGSRVDARITTTAAARSRGVNTRRYYPVDRTVGGTNGGFAIPEDKYKVPEGASNVRYDSFKDKYVPVFTSGDKKKNSKKDLPRDYGL